MSRPNSRIVLGSASPRRRDLLEQLGLEVLIRPADIDETERPGEDPLAYVRRLAAEKCSVVAAFAEVTHDDVVIAADTTVDLDGRILAKPEDAEDARAMLRALSSRTHRVHTGVAVSCGGRLVVDVTTTFVTFTPVTDAALEWYVGTGEPFGKAGAYAIQGAGGVFVSSVKGSVSNVVGLPLTTVVALARQLDIDLV